MCIRDRLQGGLDAALHAQEGDVLQQHEGGRDHAGRDERQSGLHDEALLGVRDVRAEHPAGGHGDDRAEADGAQPAHDEAAQVRAAAAHAEAQQVQQAGLPVGQRAVEHDGVRLEGVRAVLA